MQALTIEPHEVLCSYDVTALFTSVPDDKAVKCILKKPEHDTLLYKFTSLTPRKVCALLEFCLSCTYFMYGCQFYRQIHGAAMG